jgi:hypothetical protein
VRPYLEKPITEKRAGGVVQVVECLPSKSEALSLNSSTAKKKKKRKKRKKERKEKQQKVRIIEVRTNI